MDVDYRTLPESYYDDMPESLILADGHPANDQYLRDITTCKRQIMDASASMTGAQVQMCKSFHQGKSFKEIAEAVGCTPTTVSKHCKSDKGRRLISLLRHLALAIDGPADAQRRHTLWRIAMNNEDEDPRISISAISEINKMTHQEKLLESGQAGAGKFEIIINSTAFPKGVLDV